MAITSLSQCFDKETAFIACGNIESAIYDLKQLISSLENAEKCVNNKVFIMGVNTFENRIKSLIKNAESEIQKLNDFQASIKSLANNFYNSDYSEYKAYLDSLEKSTNN